MRLFTCHCCGQTVFFENASCERCGCGLGFSTQALKLLTLERRAGQLVPVGGGPSYRYCANARHAACNWLIPETSTDEFCAACKHNRTIPDLAAGENLSRWQAMETAKHRLFYTLMRLGLPMKNLAEDPAHGLAFDFLADPPGPGPQILTGHEEGLITINLTEADDAMRERFRTEMGEPYRTLLGHFRHEVGHYYWNMLVRDMSRLEECRAVFGDERLDYGTALQTHYEQGPPLDWAQTYISAYASAHPWEDFAESWAHYLHIVDTLETASAFGLRIHPHKTDNEILHTDIDFDPHGVGNIEALVEAWLPLRFAMNSINRSMGLADMYPFVLSATVIRKLGFIQELVHGP
ncbi:zinc-binding metallopeptidase family protein [Acidocella sp.]|uniref:zinc-binding metallopeptidase family protein n=1 Tax=Acidocella sp. TaxID=50710 RepID=UPI003CFD9739